MKVIVASNNNGKISAVKTIFPNAEVIGLAGESNVSTKPINNQTFLGAYNRANNISENADLIVAVEGGYFIIDNKYYIVDVACIKDSNGYKFGNSDFFEISKNMYDCISSKISLNDIIINLKEFKESYSEFKEKYGVIGYLSNKKYTRTYGSVQAVQNALESEYVTDKNFKIDKKNIVKFKNEQFNKLDTACKSLLQNKTLV